jgi:hypothetical protein
VELISMLGMRELATQAMAMRNANKSAEEIRSFVFKGATALATEQRTNITEVKGEKGWEIRLVGTGEVVAYSEDHGYSFRRFGYNR